MIDNLKENLIEYLILFVAVAVFLVLFFLFRFDKSSLLIVSSLGSIFYVGWGIIHHMLRGRLTKIITLEYLLFGLLVFLLLFTVLNF
ncbi:hypothetical protein ACFLZ4_00390 [Patescibacteria group bacterium]